MDNEQHGTALRFNLRRTDHMPALFFGFGVDAVRISHQQTWNACVMGGGSLISDRLGYP
jgi:hypothetical protein